MKKDEYNGGVFGNWLETLKPKHLWFIYIAWIILYRILDAIFLSGTSIGLDNIDGPLEFVIGWLIMATLSLSVFVLITAILLGFKGESEGTSYLVAVSFIVGALCSGLAGFIGMKVATKANVRTTNAARESLGKALEIAFSGGAVMGLGVVGLGVLGF